MFKISKTQIGRYISILLEKLLTVTDTKIDHSVWTGK